MLQFLTLAVFFGLSYAQAVTFQQVQEAQASGKYVCECDRDLECGLTGECVGAGAGTCNCSACINLKHCDGDRDCGGLLGACNLLLRTCQCQKAFDRLGYPTILDQQQRLCGVRNCNLGCFGLPCRQGFCRCPLGK
ncbi:unnamed protein product, partial [Mesorhabditis spiculigera]